jgi:hypothetical protein
LIQSDDKAREIERKKGTILGIDKLKQAWMKSEAEETFTIRYINYE